ncbi:MAG: sugar phosphate isomerase/epimerase family protein [Planctomycetia bacterium]|nr:sugar phosphate isomerase/epimerase family protein [Planctomycetia bacterium]
MRTTSRRQFLTTAAAATAGIALMDTLRAEDAAPQFRTTLHRSWMGGTDEKQYAEIAEAGFEGLESTTWDIAPTEAEKVRRMADRLGLRIHSVLRGWTNFNQADAFEADVKSVERSLEAAAAYGSDAVLLVPCRTGVAGPAAGQFDIECDDRGNVKRVVKGDNAPFADYIRAQNEANDATRRAMDQLIPVAERTGVIIALENVWNGLWCMPDLFAKFIRSFDNPWVKCYYDVGNHVKYAKPEEWFTALGDLIVKIHIKDFRLDATGHNGEFVHPRDGSVNWPSVRKMIDEIGYNGWLTIEDGGLSLVEFRERLDLIIAGK